MSFNLLDAAKGVITNELVNKAGSFLGESEGGISKALGGILPTVISSVINRGSTSGGADAILKLAGDQNNSGILGNPASFFENDSSSAAQSGAGILNSLFGDKLGSIGTLISNFAGIKPSSTSTLFSMAAPIVLGLLGKHISASGLGASGLMSFLSGQKSSVETALPPGLNLSSVLGNAESTVKHAAVPVVNEAEENSSGALKLLLPLLLLVLLAGASYYLFGTTGEEHATGADSAKSEAEHVVVTEASAKESFKVKLVNGVEIDAYKGGIEDKLVTFLNTDYKVLGADSLKNIWFDFDDLNFKIGSAEITTESKRQVDNMIAILKAYPAVKLKIGGYTDKVGDEAANKKLSGARATAVKDALTKAGVSAQVASAEGYGSQFAQFAADAPESDRVKDRHVSVSVRL